MIFAIKPFEIHDGDGIRTTVFFKGCPLRCKWCHNPESFSFQTEILYDADLCRHCLACTSLCNANLAKDGTHVYARENCTVCGMCEPHCPHRAFEIVGKEMSAEEIAAEVLRDGVLYTGDLGFLDDDGCLHVTGRKKDILVLPSGTKVFLPEYEAAIRATLTCDEVAVVLSGGRPVLVTAEELGSRDEVLGRLAALMAEQPRSSQLADVRVLGHKLPRTATGKVKRWEIQKEIDA